MANIYPGIESECYYGRHKFKAGFCERENCTVDQNNLLAIYAKRWFAKSFGNTYHSVTIPLPDGTTLRAPFCYGYGEQYTDTAMRLLAQHFGDTPRDGEHLLPYLTTKGYWCVIHCEDVARKKDL